MAWGLLGWLALAAAGPAWAQGIRPESAAGGQPRIFSAVSPELPSFLPRGFATRTNTTVTNPGPDTWFPGERYYLSYHWLNVLGSVSVWDGLRSPLPAPVAPGKAATVSAVVETPPYPGVYFLQWDVVREGAGWISRSRNTQAPATTMVVVYPAVTDLGSIASLLTAFALLRRRRGSSRVASRGSVPRLARAPAIWCGVALLSRECYIASQAQLHLGLEGWLFRLGAAGGLAVALLLAPARVRNLAAAAFLITTTTAAWADLLYVRMFGDFPAATALAAWKQLPALRASIAHLTFRSDVLLFADLLPGSLLLWRTRTELPALASNLFGRTLALCGMGVLVASLVIGIAGEGNSVEGDQDAQVFRDAYVVERFGALGYHVWDAVRVAEDATLPFRRQALDEEIDRYFEQRSTIAPRTDGHFGIARGQNVVIIQAESLQRFVVGLRVANQEITPHLNQSAREGLWFSRIQDQTGQGRTSDAEFVVATSLLPLASGAVAFRFPNNRYAALPGILREAGYSTLSAVPFDGSFWNRSVVHQTYGFDRSLFNWDFEPGQTVGWGLNDRDFLRQMIPRLKRQPQPFLAWMITLSLHYPFDDFPGDLRRLDLPRTLPRPVVNYLEAMHLFDRAYGEFLESLRREGMLDNSLVVVFGDHDAGLSSDELATLGLQNAGDAARRVWFDEVPLVVRGAAVGPLAGDYPTVGGQVDIAPTLLGLLGIDPGAFRFMGFDLLAGKRPEPVVKPSGDWKSARHVFSAAGPGTSRPLCSAVPNLEPLPLKACGVEQHKATRLLKVSNAVIRLDAQRR